MNRPTRPRNSGSRITLIFVAMFALVIPAVLFFLPGSSAQVGSVRTLAGLGMISTLKPNQQQDSEPISSQAVGFAETKPLREIAKQAPAKLSREEAAEFQEEAEKEAAENRAVKHPTAEALARASVPGGIQRDTAIQTTLPAPNMPSPAGQFDGLSNQDNFIAFGGRITPPDTDGSVGPNHYVQQINILVRVWNKAGTPLTAPFKLSSLFASLGGQCAVQDAGDPIVLYDPLADRWMLSQFAFASLTAPPYHQCIAISKTPDPTGAYFAYDFITAGNEFPDYPKIGIWPDGYYMMVHQFTNGGPFNGSGVYSFDRVKMIAGNPTASYVYFNLNLANHPEGIGGLLPSNLDGVTPPPPGRPNTFAYFTSVDFSDPADGLRLFDFHVDFATPANSTFTERAETTYATPLAVAPFSLVTPTGNQGRRAVPQPSPADAVTAAVDAITDRLMHRMQYRNQGGYETLVMNHTVGAPASTTFGTFRAAPRYYELRSTGGGPFAVQEQATFAPGGSPGDNISRWMGSAAEDNQGNLAIGYSVSSGAAGGNVFPGIRYAGRLATDPPGGLAQGEATLIDGTGVQRDTGNNRWGDYSALSVDPTDDCTFWYTQMYYTLASQGTSTVGFLTRIGSFKFPTCTSPAKGTAHFTVTNCVSLALIANASISIDGNPYGATIANGTYDASLIPGPHTYSVTKAGHTVATGNFNITDAQTTNVAVCLDSGSVHFVVTDCLTSNPISGAAITIDGNPAGSTAANGTFDSDQLAGSHSYSISKLHYATASGTFNIVNGQTTNTPVCLDPAADVSITKTADATYANAGSQVGFNVTLTNNGLATATGLSVTDNLPGAASTNWSIDAGHSSAGWSVSGSPPNQSLVYSLTTMAAGASTHVHVTSSTSGACVSTISLDNTASFTTSNDGSGSASASVSVLCPPTPAGNVTVTATAATPGPTGYATLKDAFDAVNIGTHKGAVTMWIFGNTTEPVAGAVLNASGSGSASYASVLILPSGGARTISGLITAGSPLINLNGADNVSIDGLNSGGNSLTLSNTTVSNTAGTSTIRFIEGATNDAVKNCTILGSSAATTGTATANVLFSTSTIAGGNSNNTISNNNIGPAGVNLPNKGVMGLGTAANPNTGNVIDNNNVFDFFSPTISASGVNVQANNNNWTISNNRIYQTAARTFTGAALRYAGMTLNASTGAFTVVGNKIGFGAANGTGTTTISGSTNTVRGIDAASTSTTVATSIQGNIISGINQTTATTGTGTSTNFIGVILGSTDGFFNVGNSAGNTIGSLDGSSTIVINANAGTGIVYGIFNFSFGNTNISNNSIGAITIQGTATGVGFRGIFVNTATATTATLANNTIGGTVAGGAITDSLVGSYAMYAIQTSLPSVTITGNVIRNINGNSNGAGLIIGSGVLITTTSTVPSTVSRNVVHSLSNNSGAASNSIYAIYCSFATGPANIVERNLVHSLSINSTALTSQLVGILPIAGSGTYKNNMVRLGLDASGNSITGGYVIYGMFEVAGTNSLDFNSVYVGGSGVTSSSNTIAFVSNVTTGARNYVDNIFWNARSNASGTGKNYAISLAGLTGATSNYNDLYATGTGGFVGSFGGDQTTLANWRSATGQDANSISSDPLFVNATGTAANVNLHIQPASPCISMGNPVAGVTNDFDNDARDAAPDIGADEFVTATECPSSTNVARSSYGATAVASSEYSANFPASGAIDGEHDGNNWGAAGAGGWNDQTRGVFPDNIQVNFNVNQTIGEIDVYTLKNQPNNGSTVNDTTPATSYGITNFNVQYWTGTAWADVPGGAVTGNTLAKRKFIFANITTDKVRVLVGDSADHLFSRVVEIEAYSCTSAVVPPPPTPTPTPCPTNVASSAAGSTAVASSTYSANFPASGAIDGEHNGNNWGAAGAGGWNDQTRGVFPDDIQVNFNVSRTINDIDVYTLKNTPNNGSIVNDTTVATSYGITNFNVQYWTGSIWTDVPGGAVTGNTLAKRRFIFFTPITTDKIRVVVNDSADHLFSRVVEIEAFSCGP